MAEEAELPVSHEKTIITVDEWTEACAKATEDKMPILLQIGAEWCERCPAMHECIAKLKPDFKFAWVYSDAADTELTEHFEFSKLPAVVLMSGDTEVARYQAVPPEGVEALVKKQCPAVLRLDEDF